MALKQFKVGDRVKILPSSTEWSVPLSEVGKFGVIVSFPRSKDFRVYMDKPWLQFNARETWVVRSSHIEVAVKPGQQLEFAFMRTDS